MLDLKEIHLEEEINSITLAPPLGWVPLEES